MLALWLMMTVASASGEFRASCQPLDEARELWAALPGEVAQDDVEDEDGQRGPHAPSLPEAKETAALSLVWGGLGAVSSVVSGVLCATSMLAYSVALTNPSCLLLGIAAVATPPISGLMVVACMLGSSVVEPLAALPMALRLSRHRRWSALRWALSAGVGVLMGFPLALAAAWFGVGGVTLLVWTATRELQPLALLIGAGVAMVFAMVLLLLGLVEVAVPLSINMVLQMLWGPHPRVAPAGTPEELDQEVL